MDEDLGKTENDCCDQKARPKARFPVQSDQCMWQPAKSLRPTTERSVFRARDDVSTKVPIEFDTDARLKKPPFKFADAKVRSEIARLPPDGFNQIQSSWRTAFIKD